MNTIAAQEIKRRGISAVDVAMGEGAVHVIKNNVPRYVVLTEERYRELIDAEEAARVDQVRESLAAYDRGEVRRFASAADLLRAIDDLPEG